MNWVQLNEETQLEKLSPLSFQKPVLIFKHSTRCSVSLMAKRSFENDWNFSKEEVIPYFLDLISFRNISNLVANQFHVEHESPQLILIKDEKAIYHATHSDINFNELAKLVLGT